MTPPTLSIKLFADGAEIEGMLALARSGKVKGITTNPTLMRKAGISDYPGFAAQVLSQIKDLPISFEVFSDDLAGMEREAKAIASWGQNVYVKIPVSNTAGESTAPLIKSLASGGAKLNITAILTQRQVEEVCAALKPGVPSIVSVFAGRIADTGVDPEPMMREALKACRKVAGAELLWASTRELYNLFQAQRCGCDIITVTHDILKKLDMVGKDLGELSLDTVKMFRNDAVAAGFKIG
jgi:transaldolase